MSKINLDLKKFKHVKSDDKSTTLKHADGHELTISHKGLGPEFKAQLSALSGVAKDAQTPEQADSAKHKMADGGQVQRTEEPDDSKCVKGPDKGFGAIIKCDAEGGEVEGSTPDTMQEALANQEPRKQRSSSYDEVVKHPPKQPMTPAYAEGGKVAKYCAYCGGMAHGGECEADEQSRKMYANPLARVSQDDPAPTQPDIASSVGKAVEDIVTPSAEMKAAAKPLTEKQKAYNAEAKQRNSDLHPDEAGFPMGVPADSPLNKRYEMFTPVSGPKNVDADVANDANLSIKDKQLEQNSTLQDQAKQQQLNAEFGVSSSFAGDQPQSNVSSMPGTSAGPAPATGLADQVGALAKGYGMQEGANTAEAGALGALGQENAKLLAANAKAQQDVQDRFIKNNDELEQERQALIQDVKDGHVDPEKFWTGDKDGNGGHGRIATGIGMILAGFNPTSNPNAAIDFLNKQMDRSLQAQSANLASKQNLLSANLRQFGNIKDAAMMTRLNMMDMLQHQLQEAAAKAQNPLAAAAAQRANGVLEVQKAPMQMQMSARQTLMSLANDAQMNPADRDAALGHAIATLKSTPGMSELGDTYDKARIPGVGTSSSLTPIPKEVRDKVLAHQQLDQAVTNLKSFVSSHGGLISHMSPADRATAAALVLPVQAKFREGTLGTVYREGEQPLLDKAVKGQPLDLATYFINTEPQKMDVMLGNNSREYASTLKSVGINQYKPLGSQAAADSNIVTGKNGQQYKKVTVNGKTGYVPVAK